MTNEQKWKARLDQLFEEFVASECDEGQVVRGMSADIESALLLWCAERQCPVVLPPHRVRYFRRWLTARGHFPQQSNGRAYRLRIGVSESSRFHPNVKAVAP